MIQITQSGKEIAGASQVILFSAEDINKNFGTIEFSNNDLKLILEGKEKMDFVKKGSVFTFAVFSEQSDEALRVIGSTIQQQIAKTVSTLQLTGTDAAVLPLAEGVILSNYQFLKYCSDRNEQTFKLSTLQLSSDVDSKKIDELEKTCKVVYWSRDMVNEPVSYLTAEKLS
jgi:leucyl aminopeptidase